MESYIFFIGFRKVNDIGSDPNFIDISAFLLTYSLFCDLI